MAQRKSKSEIIQILVLAGLVIGIVVMTFMILTGKGLGSSTANEEIPAVLVEDTGAIKKSCPVAIIECHARGVVRSSDCSDVTLRRDLTRKFGTPLVLPGCTDALSRLDAQCGDDCLADRNGLSIVRGAQRNADSPEYLPSGQCRLDGEMDITVRADCLPKSK
ncbi:MAG: hypothetical protein PHC51_04200 [bacterium]|nr:hypothetical protein [bacterium]